jgi:tetratricopeptide (TPR) repeat protein
LDKESKFKFLIIFVTVLTLFVFLKNSWALFKQEYPSEAYVYTLLEEAKKSHTDRAITLAKEAIQIAPEVPEPYFFLAKKVFSLTPEALSESIKYFLKGVHSYTKSFWHIYNFTGTVLSGLWLSLFITILSVSLINLIFNLPLFVHTVLEDKRKVLIGGIAILSLLGIVPMLGIITFFGFWGVKGKLKRLFLFLMISALLLLTIGTFLSKYLPIGLSPLVKAEVGINTGRSFNYPERLFRDRDFNSMFSMALAMQNRGLLENSIKIYRELLTYNNDPKIYVNIGNCYALKGELKKAIEFYKKAISEKPLASAYYNLSVVTRELLDFAKADEYFMKAASIDLTKINSVIRIQEKESLPVLLNEKLSPMQLFQNLLNKSITEIFSPWYLTKMGIILFLIGLFYYLNKDKTIAQRCRKCGKIYCLKCESRIHWSALCSDCFKTMVSFEIPATERIEHIMRTYNFQKKRRTFLSLSSWFLPGVTLTQSTPFKGTIISFFFFFFLSLTLVSGIFNFNILLSEQGIFRIFYFFVAVVIYLYGISYTKKRVRKGLI